MNNWKTTIIGIVGGMLTAVSNGVTWQTAATGAAIALLGIASKDAGNHVNDNK